MSYICDIGTYTELIFGAAIKKDAPKEVINTLYYLVNRQNLWADVPLELSVIKGRNVLRGSGSYSFAVSDAVTKMWQDKIDGCWRLSARCSVLNYKDEIEAFLAWIKPFIGQGSGDRDFYAIVSREDAPEPTIYYLYDENYGLM